MDIPNQGDSAVALVRHEVEKVPRVASESRSERVLGRIIADRFLLGKREIMK